MLMQHNTAAESYNNGLEMWRYNASSFGIDEAIIISHSYLELNLKREHPDEERQLCRELFFATHDATANRVNPNNLVYPYDLITANERTEKSYYIANLNLNVECAKGIDRLINDSRYKTNFYNLEMAAMTAIHDYGFQRVCLVLAFNFQNNESDGRFSHVNKCWAKKFLLPDKAFNDTWLQSHAVLIDSFCGYVRKMYQDMNAERFALPGNEENGEYVGGFEIKRAITTSDDGNGFLTGYAIGHNPNAVEQWVCWQFAVREGVRHYNWGVYRTNEQAAIDAYNARVFIALNNN
jgi:hypothetical protein